MKHKTIKVTEKAFKLLKQLKDEQGIPHTKAVEIALKNTYGDKRGK